jgi:hypothetical protein
MKKEKFLFILLLPMLFVHGVKGQGYNPFPKENAFWTVIEYEQFNTGNYSSVRLYIIDGDTVFGGNSYYKIYKYYKHSNTGDTLIELHSLMREDTVQRKVWFVRLYLNETVEKLGYDFSVNVGDTVSLPALEFYDWDNALQDWVLSGDTIFTLHNISNWDFKFFFFKSINSPATFEIGEGFGDYDFPFPNMKIYHRYPTITSNVCLTVDGIVLYGTGDWCGFFPYSILESNLLDVEIFPNPCSEHLNLRFQNPTHEQVLLEFISHTGIVVFSVIVSNVESYSLNTSNFASGLYLLRLTDRQQMQTYKIIVAQ